MSTLYLVRHGQSEWNRRGRIQGRSESPLTALGRAQAHAIGDHLLHLLGAMDYDIVSSPLGRALETAQIIARRLGRHEDGIVADHRINDFNLGILSGMPGWDAVGVQHPELARLRLTDPLRFWPDGGESGAHVVQRVQAFLAERDALGRSTLVVCHGVINKFIRAVRREIVGAELIALGEDQDTVYKLEGTVETEHRAEPVRDDTAEPVRDDTAEPVGNHTAMLVEDTAARAVANTRQRR
jgi:broad specificity phosphatase PhoE